MRFQVQTELAPEAVIERAEAFYREKTGMQIDDRSDGRLALSGAIGTAKITAERAHGHTSVLAETDRGVGFDVTDVTLRFLYTITPNQTVGSRRPS